MTKQELRKNYLEKRTKLTAEEYHRLSQQLCEQFFSNFNLAAVKVIHTFIPIEKTREPDTWLFIDRVKQEFPNVQISIPKINPQTSILDNFYYEQPQQLEKNTWGILEPKEGKSTPLDMIDIVLVPLLAVDEQGHRVGYGRGFYDKFLSQCKPVTQKIGLSFFAPVKRISDTHPNDQVINALVTPEAVYKF